MSAGASCPFETLTEDRKVGGSTPPLATTKRQVKLPLTCGSVHPGDRVPLSLLTLSDREYPRLAMSYRTSYRTKRLDVFSHLRSEHAGRPPSA